MPYITIAWNEKNIACSWVPNCFYFVLWSILAGRSAQTYEKWSYFSIFSRFGLFLQIFEQVIGWPILELYKMIRVLHAVSCPIVFIWFYDWDWQGEVLKLRSFFTVFSRLGGSFSPSFWAGYGVTYVRTAQNNKNVTCSFVPNCFSFVLWARLAEERGKDVVKDDHFSVILAIWVLFCEFLGR